MQQYHHNVALKKVFGDDPDRLTKKNFFRLFFFRQNTEQPTTTMNLTISVWGSRLQMRTMWKKQYDHISAEVEWLLEILLCCCFLDPFDGASGDYYWAIGPSGGTGSLIFGFWLIGSLCANLAKILQLPFTKPIFLSHVVRYSEIRFRVPVLLPLVIIIGPVALFIWYDIALILISK